MHIMTGTSVTAEGATKLAETFKTCLKLTHIRKLSCCCRNAAHASLTWSPVSGIDDSCYTALLNVAVAAEAGEHFKWLHDIADKLPMEALQAANIDTELEGDGPGIMLHLKLLRGPKAHFRRAALIVIGYQSAGKTSLLWRLMKDEWVQTNSTHGIVFGEQWPCTAAVWWAVRSCTAVAHEER